jgi:hypothetical protein
MSRLSALLRALADAACLLGVVVAALATAVDVPRLLRFGWRAVIGTTFASLGLAVLCALIAAPVLAAAIRLTQLARRRSRMFRAACIFTVAAAACTTAIYLTDALYRPNHSIYLKGAFAFGLAFALLEAIALHTTPRAVDILLLVGAACLVAVDLVTPRLLPREAHDLMRLLAVGTALAGLEPLWRRLRAVSGGRVALALALSTALSLLCVHEVDRWFTGWRSLAWQHAQWQPRLGGVLRAAIDFDGDGYSPIAWGGDCDDLDASRNPSARDHDGIDANCNGTVRPAAPTDDERGLAPPHGDANARDIELVVLVTIDCMRADSLQEEVTPHLWQLGQSGIRLDRLYSAGTRTAQSLPLLLRASDETRPVASEFGEHAISTTALFSYANGELEGANFPGFGVTRAPTAKESRFTAAQVTDQAIATIDSQTGRGFVWIHYYDAHYPQLTTHPLPAPPGRPAEMGRYLGAIADIDREIGRLRDHLTPRWAKTILIITADHGESFGEHDIPYHRLGAYEAVAHVPGVIAGGTIPAHAITQLTSHRDLPPTLLGAFGLVGKNSEEFGRSWLRLLAAPDKPLHRFVVVRSAAATSKSESHPMAALVENRLKLIDTFENDLVELYDLSADPDEKKDLRSILPAQTAQLLHDLALYRDIDGYP